jgi:hypothetical protein
MGRDCTCKFMLLSLRLQRILYANVATKLMATRRYPHHCHETNSAVFTGVPALLPFNFNFSAAAAASPTA